MRPITILRCLRLPPGPGSRHLNSQTSGPILRSACMMPPCCIERPFCAAQAVHLGKSDCFCRHNPGTEFPTSWARRPSKSAWRNDWLSLCCGDVPLFAPDQQDKRWREQSLRGKLTFQSARATRRATPRTGWLVDIAYFVGSTWRLQGVRTRVCETLKIVLAHRLACDRGESDEA
jgi:hypothetical protein